MSDEREPIAAVLARTVEFAGPEQRVACCRCRKVGGSLINRVCGRCLGVSR